MADYRSCFHGWKPAMTMMLVQIIIVGLNLAFKLAVEDGMRTKILIAYRHIFANIFLAPIAYFVERNGRAQLTWTVTFQAFICGLLGGPVTQNLYLSSLKLTSTIFIMAMTNLIPAMTFLLTLILRMERLEIGTPAGKAKLAGTTMGVGGAMLMTFYKGKQINLWSTNIDLSHWKGAPTSHTGNQAVGLVLAIACFLCESLWLIIQLPTSRNYPSFLSLTTLVCFMGSIQSIIYALFMERKWEEWKLGMNIRLLAAAYTGIIALGLMYVLIAWTIHVRGPLFASFFYPPGLVLMTVTASLVLAEKLNVGSLIGAAMIAVRLYMMLWGKAKEMRASEHSEASADTSNAPNIPVIIAPAVMEDDDDGIIEEN